MEKAGREGEEWEERHRDTQRERERANPTGPLGAVLRFHNYSPTVGEEEQRYGGRVRAREVGRRTEGFQGSLPPG